MSAALGPMAGGGDTRPPDDEAGPIGPFPSWGALYTTVVAWALLVVLLLYLFTVFLNGPGATP